MEGATVIGGRAELLGCDWWRVWECAVWLVKSAGRVSVIGGELGGMECDLFDGSDVKCDWCKMKRAGM